MTEGEGRRALVAEALTWVGTPYKSNALVKGKRGGTDCAMVILGIYQNCGFISPEFDPRPYSPQWHLHQNAEKYLEQILTFAEEVPGPQEGRQPQPGDVVLFKLGRVFAHGAIVTSWPNVIHAVGNVSVVREDLSKNTTGKRALWTLPRRFFSYWGA